MGHEAFDCYCYYTAEPASRDDLGRPIEPPAEGRAREWRDERFDRFRVETVDAVTDALAWLEHNVGLAAEYLWQADRAAAPNLVDVIREATAALTRAPFAYEWRRRLPDGHRLALAVRGYWTTDSPSAARGPAAEDASAASGIAPRQPFRGRRFYTGGPSPRPTTE
jgi:hypothetical protein